MRTALTFSALTAVALVVSPLHAQQTTAPAAGVITSWSPFLGCWSASSNGAIGPMVCVVPGASREQAEFLTVEGDSIAARTVVDASGKRVAALRPGCRGFEQGTWASDGQRLLMHAEYRCGSQKTQRSDAILSLSQADAFTHVERSLSDARVPARVVNFIVQLDTTVFPTEVRRRLPHLRPLAAELTELESVPDVAPGVIVEASSTIDPGVVQAWLDDRGQLTPELSTTTRLMYAAAQGRDLPQPRARIAQSGVSQRMSRFGVVGLYSSAQPVYLTADHGNRPQLIGPGVGYWDIGVYQQPGGIGVPYRWP